MLNIGSGSNIIKENLILNGKIVNYTNILKLNGINEYSVYTPLDHIIPFRKESKFLYCQMFQFHNPVYWTMIFFK